MGYKMENYKEFKTEKEAQNWIDSFYDKNEFSKEELDLIYSYGGGNYKLYNKFLRGQISLDEESKEELDNFINRFSKYRLKENIIVYRYMKYSNLKYLLKKNKFNAKTYNEKGFMSTTLIPENESLEKLISDNGYNCLLRIKVPKGTIGIPIKHINRYSLLKEYEVLLWPGTKIKIDKKGIKIQKTKPFFLRIIECQIINQIGLKEKIDRIFNYTDLLEKLIKK